MIEYGTDEQELIRGKRRTIEVKPGKRETCSHFIERCKRMKPPKWMSKKVFNESQTDD